MIGDSPLFADPPTARRENPSLSIDAEDLEKTSNGKHIVDVLIEERAPNMVASRFWRLYRTFLYPLLKEPKAKRMADSLVGLSGWEAMERVSDVLQLDVEISGLENVPKTGRVLIAANHPTGIADGVAIFDALKNRRQDLKVFANRDALRVIERFDEVIIPVEWVIAKRTRQRSRETLKSTRAAFENENCVVLFPSGRLAFIDERKILIEQEWMNSVAIFARKYNAPIVPVHIESRNSWLYYWFRNLNQELRDITLFNELLNKRGKKFKFTFGAPIPHDALDGDPDAVTAALRQHTLENVKTGAPWVPISEAASEAPSGADPRGDASTADISDASGKTTRSPQPAQ